MKSLFDNRYQKLSKRILRKRNNHKDKTVKWGMILWMIDSNIVKGFIQKTLIGWVFHLQTKFFLKIFSNCYHSEYTLWISLLLRTFSIMCSCITMLFSDFKPIVSRFLEVSLKNVLFQKFSDFFTKKYLLLDLNWIS